MNILMTGATGYIGGHLVRHFHGRGNSVAVVVRESTDTRALQETSRDVRIYRYDGGQASLLRALADFKPEQVFHVASLFLVHHKSEDVDRLVASNILFPAQLLEAMNQAGIRRLINVGTSWQHYQNAPYNPVNLYAATKQAFESLLEFYVQAHGFAAVTLKLFDTYGPGDSRPKLFSLLRRTARTQTPLKMSPGQQLLDLVYIDDVADAFVLASQRLAAIDGAETYAVSGRPLIALRDLVEVYSNVVGKDLPIEWGGLAYRPREVMTPWSDFHPVPGWTPRISLAEGIRRMERDPHIGGLLADPSAPR